MLSITYSPDRNLPWQVTAPDGSVYADTITSGLACAVAEVILTEQTGTQP
jgi:hypothetical protein